MESILPYVIWGGLIFLMMRFGCGSHMFGHRQDDRTQAGHGAHDGGPAHSCCAPAPDDVLKSRWEGRSRLPAPAGQRDPVCGKTVTVDAAKTSFYAGSVHYFCSRDCREIFEAAPEAYLSGDAAFADSGTIPLLQGRSLAEPRGGQPNLRPEG